MHNTRISRLALGTVQFGMDYGIANRQGRTSLSEARTMVETAANVGIDTIDTAIGYGDSERALGSIGVAGFNVVTKLPAIPAGVVDVSDWVDKQMSDALARLDLTSVYGLLLHRPADLLEQHGYQLFEALRDLQEQSRVRKIGVSVYAPEELDLLSANFRFDLVQAPFNLIDRRLETSGWLGRLKDSGVEVHTRSAFLQGLLLMSREAIPTKFANWDRLWNRWHQWLDERGITAVQACLAFPLSITQIDRVIVGADSVDHLRQILSGAAIPSVSGGPDLNCEDKELINPSSWEIL